MGIVLKHLKAIFYLLEGTVIPLTACTLSIHDLPGKWPRSSMETGWIEGNISQVLNRPKKA